MNKNVLRGSDAIAIVAAAFAMLAVAIALWSWIIMVLVGAAYHEFDFWMPISFRQALIPGAVATLFQSSANAAAK